MNDPLSEIIALLQPRAVFSKRISGAGRWGVRYSDFGQPSFCAVLEGSCRLAVDGQRAADAGGGRLRAPAGDARLHDVGLRTGEARSASTRRRRPRRPVRSATARAAAGPTCGCSAATSSSTRPTRRCWCRCCRRWCTCAASSDSRCWCGSSATNSPQRSGRDLVLSRLVEVLLIEALRSTSGDDAPPGLLRGLADARSRPRSGRCTAHVARSWTVAQLARSAALSRSAFFERFTPHRRPAADGVPARLADGRRPRPAPPPRLRVAEVAERVGYSSASTFSTAFSRHVGQPPSRYARALAS